MRQILVGTRVRARQGRANPPLRHQQARICWQKCEIFDVSAGTHPGAGTGATARVAMALAALSGDEQRIIFGQLCNTLDPGIAVALSSVSHELRTATQGLLPLSLIHI